MDIWLTAARKRLGLSVFNSSQSTRTQYNFIITPAKDECNENANLSPTPRRLRRISSDDLSSLKLGTLRRLNESEGRGRQTGDKHTGGLLDRQQMVQCGQPIYSLKKKHWQSAWEHTGLAATNFGCCQWVRVKCMINGNSPLFQKHQRVAPSRRASEPYCKWCATFFFFSFFFLLNLTTTDN